MDKKLNFGLIGAAGYIAPRHIKAIADTGNNLLVAYDKFDSVGRLDSSFPDCSFFTENEQFDRFCSKQMRTENPLNWLSICTPNYTHDAFIRYGLRLGCNVICEKPLVLNPYNIDNLVELEAETGHQAYTILQLRLHEKIRELKSKVESQKSKDDSRKSKDDSRKSKVESQKSKVESQKPWRIVKIGLEREREELYERINRRVVEMIADGLEEEARRVYPLRHLNSLNTVGYKEMFAFIDGRLTLDEAIKMIQQNSRHYAKRQMTWFRRQKDIHWLNAAENYETQLAFIDTCLAAR